MNLRVFGITDRATLAPLAGDAASDTYANGAPRWIDIEAATRTELERHLAPLALHSTIVAACLDPGRSERLISRSNALYLEVPTHLGWDQPNKPYISIVCLPDRLLTIHRDAEHTIDDIIDGLDAEVPLYANTISALMYYLVIEIGRRNVDAALAARSEAEQLDHSAHQSPDALDAATIAALRRRVSHYAAVCDDHTYCTGVLQTVESDAFRISEQGRFFHELLRLSELARLLIDGAAARVAAVEREYELAVQRRVESRLRLLTILSAVFLPLTLISAIYGMNFTDLPAMGLRYGYLIVIGLMTATVLAMVAVLYRRGWFE